jgi:ABC-type branched-subunit amino acid transport system ATPase component
VPALLELADVHAGYVGGIDILAGIDMRVERGSITGVIGPNGAGKSTLLRTIFGFLHPARGRVLFDGEAIQGLSPHAIKRRGIGYVTQSANIFPQLTVDENLRLGAWIVRRDRRRVVELLERTWTTFPRLAARRGLRATGLSGGEAKMLSLAKEAMTEPRLLLVDEPSAGLAPRVTDQVYARLRQAREGGLTILLVDQNIARAVEVSDYLYLIERGQVRREGPRESFAAHLRDIIRDALLGA